MMISQFKQHEKISYYNILNTYLKISMDISKFALCIGTVYKLTIIIN